MDDFQTILYIVVGIIYFLSRALKKKKPPVKPSRSGEDFDDEAQESTPPKPLTFEELLREFTEGKEAEEERPARPAPVPVKRSSSQMTARAEEDDDEILEPAKRRFADDESRKIYEASVRTAENLKTDVSTQPEYGFKRYEDHRDEVPSLGAEVAEMLQDADGARKAVILSEILNRKY